MFNISADNIYDWHYLFLLISMDRVAIFLPDLGFPFLDEIDAVRATARGFVRRFYNAELGIFERDQVSRVGLDLFTATYEELARRLGPAAAARFCDWGNRMQMDRMLEWALDQLWYDLLVPWAHTTDNHSLAAPDAFQGALQAIVLRCDAALKGTYDALDVVDNIPAEGWDAEAYRYYNQGHRRKVDRARMTASPLGYLEALITCTRICQALCEIKSLAAPDELMSLIKWIDRQLPAETAIDGASVFHAVCPS